MKQKTFLNFYKSSTVYGNSKMEHCCCKISNNTNPNKFKKSKPWNLYGLSNNQNITFDIVEKHINKPWDWQMLSNNPNITSDIVEEHIKKPWNWSLLSYNPNITSDIVEKHIDKPWNWYYLSRHPNITFDFDFIKKYKHKFIHNIA